MVRREPIAEVQNGPRKEPGFREAEHKPEHTEADRAMSEGRCNGHQTPGDHDPADPEPRSDLVHNHRGGYFEEEVAKEEYARSEAVHLRCQAQIMVHGQRGEPHVDPIEKSNQVEQHQERNQPPGDLANHPFFEEAGSRHCDVAHSLPLAVNAAFLWVRRCKQAVVVAPVRVHHIDLVFDLRHDVGAEAHDCLISRCRRKVQNRFARAS